MSFENKPPVLCIPRRTLFPLGAPQGFFPIPEAEARNIVGFIEAHGIYVPRAHCETDRTLKQVIPQIALIAEGRIFMHRVPNTGTDSRFHEMHTCLLGGHAEPDDNGFLGAVRREFAEEIGYDEPGEASLVGYVNLEEPEANAVHVGLLYVVRGARAVFTPKPDEGVADGEFMTWEAAARYLAQMTWWAQACFPYLRQNFGDGVAPAHAEPPPVDESANVAAYKANPSILSPHWHFTFPPEQREAALALREARVPLVFTTSRRIAERIIDAVFTFRDTGVVAHAFAFKPHLLEEDEMREQMRDFLDGYPTAEPV